MSRSSSKATRMIIQYITVSLLKLSMFTKKKKKLIFPLIYLTETANIQISNV